MVNIPYKGPIILIGVFGVGVRMGFFYSQVMAYWMNGAQGSVLVMSSVDCATLEESKEVVRCVSDRQNKSTTALVDSRVLANTQGAGPGHFCRLVFLEKWKNETSYYKHKPEMDKLFTSSEYKLPPDCFQHRCSHGTWGGGLPFCKFRPRWRSFGIRLSLLTHKRLKELCKNF
eukprot:Platyproteum_vivax@DN2582_c0_g1_i2.p1